MKRLIYTFRYLTRNRGNNLIRILSMTLGLVVGAILLSQVAFDTSFDRFIRMPTAFTRPGSYGSAKMKTTWPTGCSESPGPFCATSCQETVSGTMFSPNAIYVPFITRIILTFSRDCTTPIPYFSIFRVKLTQGDLRSGFLSDRNIFLSGSCAERMFGGRNPVGEMSFTTSPPLTPWRACSRIFRKTAH